MRTLVIVPAAVALLVLGAWSSFSLPGTDVPQTGQTLAVLLIGSLAGARRGSTAVAAYLLLGAGGLPVFADGAGGVAILLGPTGGFLAGFLPAAAAAGWLHHRIARTAAGRIRYLALLTLSMLGCHGLILVCGWARLATLVGPLDAYVAGVAPFMVGAVAKSTAAALLTAASTAARERYLKRHRVASRLDRPG